MENTLLLILPVVAALAVAGTIPPLVSRRRRRRATANMLTWISTLDTAACLPEGARLSREAVPTPEPADSLQVRILRNQVRTLEQALEQEQGISSAATAEQELESYRRQVHVVIRALRGHVEPDESGSEALARVAAAVDRLVPAGTFARPTLTTAASPVRSTAGRPGAAPTAAPATYAASLDRPSIAQHATTAVMAGAGAAGAAGAGSAAVATVEQPLPVWEPEPGSEVSLPAEPEVVLPVPPPPAPEETRRTRRWPWRGRAA